MSASDPASCSPEIRFRYFVKKFISQNTKQDETGR
jgi:hypothetical protein